MNSIYLHNKSKILFAKSNSVLQIESFWSILYNYSIYPFNLCCEETYYMDERYIINKDILCYI
jgi:hypothetical protein